MFVFGKLCYIIATSGAAGRAALMREIELGKQLFGEENEPLNVVKFLGSVTRGKTSCLFANSKNGFERTKRRYLHCYPRAFHHFYFGISILPQWPKLSIGTYAV